jgi:hypothetical protein
MHSNRERNKLFTFWSGNPLWHKYGAEGTILNLLLRKSVYIFELEWTFIGWSLMMGFYDNGDEPLCYKDWECNEGILVVLGRRFYAYKMS